MNSIDKLKEKYENGEVSADVVIGELFNVLKYNETFINSLIKKYEDEKVVALENMKLFKGSNHKEWYDSAFTHLILFLWDLGDIKCRSGLFHDGEC